jgi:hypothetical protein
VAVEEKNSVETLLMPSAEKTGDEVVAPTAPAATTPSIRLRSLGGWLAAIVRVHIKHVRITRRFPNILSPRRFTDKVEWRKLFDMNPLYTILSDKLAVRGFIASRVGEQVLLPLIWSGTPEDIPFDRLRAPFVLKSNHASAQAIMIGADSEVRPHDLRRQATEWLQLCYGTLQDEPGYVGIPRRLLVERTVVRDDGSRPDELRFFVFDGKVAIINTVFPEAGRIRNGAFHTPEWKRLDWRFTRWVERDFPRPKRLSDMLRIAERLGEGIDFIRVDFYDCGERIYAGEMTVYPWSGLARFNPDAADVVLGAYWKLKNPLRRALAAVLSGKREIVAPAAPAEAADRGTV